MRIRPAFVVFVALFVVATGVQLAEHNGTGTLIEAAILAVLCLFTRWLTAADGVADPSKKGRFFSLQIVACAIVVVGTVLWGLSFNHVTPAIASGLGFISAHDAIVAAILPYVSYPFANGIAVFVLYCIPIAIVLALLGIPLWQQGLGRFRRGSLPVAFVWLVLPVGAFAWAALTGHLPVRRILRVWLANLLQNGFSEEFLWRGAIMGRLQALIGTEGALYLQAVLFGLWHVDADYRLFAGNFLLMFANIVTNQITFGLALGYLTQRTGNVAIGSVFHMLSDSADDLL